MPDAPTPTSSPGARPESWATRFPALASLNLVARRRRIPVVRQMTDTECGAACLAMVLGYWGRSAELADVRQKMIAGRDGINAVEILQAGRRLGLQGRGLKVDEVDGLRFLEAGTILHWKFNHFVVLERLTRRGAWIIDPARGREHIAKDRLDASFTGVALSFEPGEDFIPNVKRRKVASRYLNRLKEEGRELGRIVVVSAFLHVLALSVPLLTALAVDRIVPSADLQLLGLLIIGGAGVAVFHLAASLVRAFLLLHLRTRLDLRMALEFLGHLVDLPFAFFQRRSAGDLLMRLGSNATVREILTTGVLSGLLDGVMVSLYLILLFAASPAIGTLVLGLGATRIALFLLTRGRIRERMSEALESQAEARSYEFEVVAGIESLKASGTESTALQHWSKLFVREMNASLARGRLDAVVKAVLDGLSLVSPLVVLLFGAHLTLEGHLSLGTMLALNALAIGFLTPLTTLVSTAFQLQLLGSYFERIDDVLRTPRERVDDGQRGKRLTGRISIDNVTFAYEGGQSPAVETVSIEIMPGQQVAIVGPSGSGKSTLAALLAGLYEPQSGVIRFDGKDVAALDLRWLRSQLGFVAQQPYLFARSIRANIAFNAPSMPMSDVAEAARLAAIHGDIMSMPMGYETILAERGASLSGGQRQRLALARALARRPSILILDEATSALDAVTEEVIQGHLDALRSTRIIIAHRLSTVRQADRILVMDRGRIVEQGDHQSLVELGGRYSDLVAAQLREDRSGPGTGSTRGAAS